MKQNFSTIAVFLCCMGNLWAQNVGIGTSSPAASAKLEIQSTNSGILIPRMTNAEKTAIALPATGLLIYQTDATAGFYYYDGTAWIPIMSGIAGWKTTGNAGTFDGLNFIGTTDDNPLVVGINNMRRARFTNKGHFELFTDNFSVFVGESAGADNVTGNAHTALGYHAMQGGEGNASVAIGYNALNAGGGFWNTAVGAQVLQSNTTGGGNTAVGHVAMVFNTTGTDNTALGRSALYYNTLGEHNVAMGWQSLTNNTLGNRNVSIGTRSGEANITGNDNILLGYMANTSSSNLSNAIAIGANTIVAQSNSLILGNNVNVGIGTSAPSNKLSVNGTIHAIDVFGGGGVNILIGDDAFFSDIDMAHRAALISSTNSSLGELQLGYSGTSPILYGNPGYLNLSQELRIQNDNNRFRRAGQPVSFLDLFDNGIVGVHISNNESEEGGFWANGNFAVIYNPADNDLIKFVDEDNFNGNGTTHDNGALKATIDAAGQYFQLSDAKTKNNIRRLSGSLQKVLSLNGYSYQFNLLPVEVEKGNKPIEAVGILAQELEQVLPEAVRNEAGHYIVNYSAITPLLIEAIKEQQVMIETLQKEINTLRSEIKKD